MSGRVDLAKFVHDIGMYLDGEDLEKTYEESQDLQKFPHINQPDSNFGGAFDYYSGIHHIRLEPSLVQMAQARIQKAQELLNIPLTTLEQYSSVARRGNTFFKEVEGLQNAVKNDRDALARRTDELFCILRLICKVIQAVVFYFAPHIVDTTTTLEDVKWKLIEESLNPLLDQRVKVGNTLCRGEEVGVYAGPVVRGDKRYVSFSGDVSFSLKGEKTKTIYGCFSIGRSWHPAGGGLACGEDSCNEDIPPGTFRKGQWTISQLWPPNPEAGRKEIGARDGLVLLTKVAAELLYMHPTEASLCYSNYYDHADVLVAGGFTSDSDHARKIERIRARIEEARKQELQFPKRTDYFSFPLYLHRASLTRVQTDFGDGPAPYDFNILDAAAAKIPDFWVRHFPIAPAEPDSAGS